MNKRKKYTPSRIVLQQTALAVLLALFLAGCQGARSSPTPEGIQVEAAGEFTPDAGCAELVRAMRAGRDPAKSLAETYAELRVIDAHNHGAAEDTLRVLKRQRRYFIDRTVLFGAISEPAAVDSDRLSYLVYAQYPDEVIPFFAGIPIYDRAGITTTLEYLEQGYFGVGEIVGASTQSPMTSQLPWKAEHPNDGNLPEIYQISARTHAPVLLHIDPPDGEPIARLEQALDENPETILIFGHANAFNTPENLERLAAKHSNLWFDFFAGFTAYNLASAYKLADFVPLIENYADRFVVSTDSGYDVGAEQSLQAIYELLDLLSPETACQVASQNLERLIESQAPTAWQIRQIEELSRQVGEQGVRRLNKHTANELIFELRKRTEE